MKGFQQRYDIPELCVCDIAQWVNSLTVAAEMSEWKQLFRPTALMCGNPSRHQSFLKATSPKIVFPVKFQLEKAFIIHILFYVYFETLKCPDVGLWGWWGV